MVTSQICILKKWEEKKKETLQTELFRSQNNKIEEDFIGALTK